MTVILFPDGVWALSLPLISLWIIGILILINKKFLKYLSCWNVHLFEMLNCFGNVVKCCQKQVQMQYDSEVSVLAYLKKNDLWKSDLKKEKKKEGYSNWCSKNLFNGFTFSTFKGLLAYKDIDQQNIACRNLFWKIGKEYLFIYVIKPSLNMIFRLYYNKYNLSSCGVEFPWISDKVTRKSLNAINWFWNSSIYSFFKISVYQCLLLKYKKSLYLFLGKNIVMISKYFRVCYTLSKGLFIILTVHYAKSTFDATSQMI